MHPQIWKTKNTQMNQQQNTTGKVLLNWIALVGMLAVNALANILPINGYNTGQVSGMYPNRFVPAGFTFGIWSIIYILLIGFVVMSSWLRWRQPGSAADRIAGVLSPYFIGTCALNALWILVWHYLQTTLSVLVMLAFLFLLIRIYLLLQPYRKTLTVSQRVWLYIPFVVYLGWISVATIANITAWLVGLEWGAWGIDPSRWSIALMAIAATLGLIFTFRKADAAYTLVIAWARYGIYKGQQPAYPEVGRVAMILSSLMTTGVIAHSVFRLVRPKA
jgi:hypothetical protein